MELAGDAASVLAGGGDGDGGGRGHFFGGDHAGGADGGYGGIGGGEGEALVADVGRGEGGFKGGGLARGQVVGAGEGQAGGPAHHVDLDHAGLAASVGGLGYHVGGARLFGGDQARLLVHGEYGRVRAGPGVFLAGGGGPVGGGQLEGGGLIEVQGHGFLHCRAVPVDGDPAHQGTDGECPLGGHAASVLAGGGDDDPGGLGHLFGGDLAAGVHRGGVGVGGDVGQGLGGDVGGLKGRFESHGLARAQLLFAGEGEAGGPADHLDGVGGGPAASVRGLDQEGGGAGLFSGDEARLLVHGGHRGIGGGPGDALIGRRGLDGGGQPALPAPGQIHGDGLIDGLAVLEDGYLFGGGVDGDGMGRRDAASVLGRGGDGDLAGGGDALGGHAAVGGHLEDGGVGRSVGDALDAGGLFGHGAGELGGRAGAQGGLSGESQGLDLFAHLDLQGGGFAAAVPGGGGDGGGAFFEGREAAVCIHGHHGGGAGLPVYALIGAVRGAGGGKGQGLPHLHDPGAGGGRAVGAYGHLGDRWVDGNGEGLALCAASVFGGCRDGKGDGRGVFRFGGHPARGGHGGDGFVGDRVGDGLVFGV